MKIQFLSFVCSQGDYLKETAGLITFTSRETTKSERWSKPFCSD